MLVIVTRLVSISTQGMVTINGLELLKGPETTLIAKGWIGSGRVTTYPNPSGGTGGSVRLTGDVGALVGLSRGEVTFTPNPNGLAVMDCLPSNRPINQYLITEGVPCTITYAGTDAEFLERVRQEADWTLSSPPLSLWPRLANRKNYAGQVLPVEYAWDYIGGYAENDGLSFDYRNGLPSNDLGFGIRTLTHSLAGLGVSVSAQVALFYPVEGREHPAGGPIGYEADANDAPDLSQQIPPTDTPNWIYYYDQIWKNPYGVKVNYYNNNGSGSFYSTGLKQIFLGNETHALLGSYDLTHVYAEVSGQGLKEVGTENVRGLDTYARIVLHESIHKKLMDVIAAGGPNIDLDHDGLPNDTELHIGLNPNNADTLGWATGDDSHYASYADEEVFVRMCEFNYTASSTDLNSASAANGTEDWADDGFNWKGFRTTPPNRTQRVVQTIFPQYIGSQLTYIAARSFIP